jgi:hypothetical protein
MLRTRRSPDVRRRPISASLVAMTENVDRRDHSSPGIRRGVGGLGS